MRRKIWAFVAFNLYSVFLISAFQENTAYLFDVSLINEMILDGTAINPREWGWGSHYIWRIFAGVAVTVVAGFLAGSVAKSKGSLTAVISNIPSVLIWILAIYSFGFSDIQLEEKTAFVIISIIAIPLTTCIAFIAGGIGEKVQKEEFEEDTVLGVKPYHWIWAIFPIYWYATSIIYDAAQFISFQFTTLGNISIVVSFMSLFTLLPILAWIYPLILVYQVLTGRILSKKTNLIRCMANFAILVLGMIIASGLESGCYWLLAKMTS